MQSLRDSPTERFNSITVSNELLNGKNELLVLQALRFDMRSEYLHSQALVWWPTVDQFSAIKIHHTGFLRIKGGWKRLISTLS